MAASMQEERRDTSDAWIEQMKDNAEADSNGKKEVG